MNSLNKQQQIASQPSTGGASLVLAGAGTGKTKTLVEKVKNIILHTDIKPENILILTFSRKASSQIKDRIVEQVGEDAGQITSGTFHSFCLNFLKVNKVEFLNYAGFAVFPEIIDDEKREILINEIINIKLHKFLGIPQNVVSNIMQRIDNIDGYTLKKLKETGLLNEFEITGREYSEKKKFLGLMDYEDMIMFVLSMLKSNESLRNEAHKKFKYILVDEYQDTSENNFELLKMLLPQKNYNLFTVGDDWQSIYGFRSAKVEYIINMKKFFPGVKIHKLKVNYRSNKEIVKLSNKFIKNNRSRTRKILKSHKGKGGRVMFYKASGIEQEAEIIQRIILSEKNKTKDIAILFRNNWQGKFIESKFFGNGEISNGLNFLTMHASKGLEFDTVIITGISDKIIPDRSSNIEEERRLMYVALTRAKERLHLIHHLNDEKERSVFCKELGIPID